MVLLCPCVSYCVFDCKVDWPVGCSKLLLFQVVLLLSRGGCLCEVFEDFACCCIALFIPNTKKCNHYCCCLLHSFSQVKGDVSVLVFSSHSLFSECSPLLEPYTRQHWQHFLELTTTSVAPTVKNLLV